MDTNKPKRTATINVRIEPEVKKEAEEIFAQWGLSLSDAISLYLRKTIMTQGIPFDLRN